MENLLKYLLQLPTEEEKIAFLDGMYKDASVAKILIGGTVLISCPSLNQDLLYFQIAKDRILNKNPTPTTEDKTQQVTILGLFGEE